MRLLTRLLMLVFLLSPVAGLTGWTVAQYTVSGRNPLEHAGLTMPACHSTLARVDSRPDIAVQP